MSDTFDRPPDVRSEPWEIAVWNPRLKQWLRGRSADAFIPRDIITLTWTATGDNTDVSPDHDAIIDILYASRIAIQIDSTDPDNTSTDFDVNVETSMDRANWDTVPYAQDNIGDAEIKTFLVNPGPRYMRLRGDANGSSETGYITARIQIVD